MKSITLKVIFSVVSAILVIVLLTNHYHTTKYISDTADTKVSSGHKEYSHVHVNESNHPILFYEHIVHFFEQGTPLTLDDVLDRLPHQEWIKSRNSKESPSYGFSKRPVWLKFTIVNNTAKDIEKTFDITNPLLDKIDFYILPENSPSVEYHEGDSYPFASRHIPHNTFLFSVLFEANSKTEIYIRAESTGSLSIPIEMTDISSINEKSQLSDLIERGYVGVCFVMFFFNLFIFFATKEVGYFYYTLYIASLSIMTLGMNGYGYQFFWPTSVWFQANFLSVFLPATSLSTLLFFYSFLEIHNKEIYLQWIVKFWIAVSFTLFALAFVLPWSAVVLPNTVSYIIITPMLLLLATKELLKGDPNAKLYFIAWLPVNITLCTTGLTRANVINIELPSYWLITTIMFEMILISLALAEKINRSKSEKDEAQRIAIKNLQKYERLYNQAIEGMFSYDEANQSFKCNQAFLNLFDTGDQNNIQTLPSIFNYFPANNRAQISSILSKQGSIKGFETPIISQNLPKNIWVSLAIQSSHSEDGESRTYDGIFVDISERIQKEQANLERREAKKMGALREKENRSKSDFFASMSHEYRTPLNAIIGFTQILEEEDLTPKQSLFLEHIKTGGQDLLALVNDVLDISKIEAQKLDFETIAVDIFAMLDHIEASFAVQAAKKGILFSVDYKFPLPEHVLSDPIRIKQTILNLCSNAIKFTDSGEVILRVHCDSQNEKLYFSVIDSGIGLKPEQLENLFEAYTQAEQSTSRKYGGTGLGLNLSKTIAKNLGGDIVVESKFGLGSTFTLSISTGSLINVRLVDSLSKNKILYNTPNTIEKTDHDHGDAANADFPNQQNPMLQNNNYDSINDNFPMSVLLVEDNIVNQRIISHIICQTGIKCTIATNGLEAIGYITMQKFSLVLMDIHMPLLSGLEAVKFLREKGVDIPIIALSGDASEADRKRSLNAGFDSHIIKPIDVMELRKLLAKQLANETPKIYPDNKI